MSTIAILLVMGSICSIMFFAVRKLYGLATKKPYSFGRPLLISIVAFVVGLIVMPPPTPEERAAREKADAIERVAQEKEEAAEKLSRNKEDQSLIKKEIDSTISVLNSTEVPEAIDADNIMILAALPLRAAELYTSEHSQGVDRAALKKASVAYQIRTYPKLRKAFANKLALVMWENNIYVEANGTTLRFIGGIFAHNKNVADAESYAAPSVKMLRFKQTRYEWYRGSEYNYYTHDTPSDSEFVMLDDSNNYKKVENQ